MGEFNIKLKKHIMRLERSIGSVVVDFELLYCGHFLYAMLTFEMDFCENNVNFP